MTEYNTRYNAENLVFKLQEKGFISDKTETEKFITESQIEEELPLYLRFFVGVGAFLSSCFLIGLLGLLDILDTEIGTIITGVVLIGIAIWLIQIRGKEDTIKHTFITQSSFTFIATGKSLFVFGFASFFESIWAGVFAILIITVATYKIYRMSIDRFLSSLAFLGSLFVALVFELERYFVNFYHKESLILIDLPILADIAFIGYFLVLAVSSGLFITGSKIKSDYIPLGYALITMVCGFVMFFIFEMGNGDVLLFHKYFHLIILSIGLFYIANWVADNKLSNRYLSIIVSGIIILATISILTESFAVNGIFLALILLVSGYAKHDRLLTTGGIIFLPVFIFLYYYNLQTTLLMKSFILMASGGVLLLGRLFMERICEQK